MSPLVLTSTPQKPSEGDTPRQDFPLLAESLGGSVLYPVTDRSDSLLSRIERRTASDIRQALTALKRRRTVSAYISLSEKIGIPLALLLPRNRANRPAHVLVAHRLTSPSKRKLQTNLGYLSRFDRVVVLTSAQSAYLTQEAGYPADRVAFVLDGVDDRFWRAGSVEGPGSPPPPNSGGAGGWGGVPVRVPVRHEERVVETPPFTPPAPPELGGGGLPGPAPSDTYILTVGRERRDYATFFDALRALPDAQAVVVASSPWSRQDGFPVDPRDVPSNITFRNNLPYGELRALYAGASLVVVPILAGTDYAAGVNVCLEGMAMGKPVIATATPGLAEYIQGDATGEARMATAPPTSAGLAETIHSLLADPARQEQLSRIGRRFIEEHANLDQYIAAVSRTVQEALPER